MLKLAVGSALLVTVTQTLALTLGPTQGDVIIGRPFDVLVQSRIDPNLAGTDLCLQAQLFYGEAAVAAGSVSTAVHAAAPDGTILLRVRSSEAVNEPIVTLVLQAGCQNAFRRSYALLADFQPAVLTTATPALAAGAPVQAAMREPVPAPGAVPAVLAARAVAPAAAQAEQAVPGPETPIRLADPAPRPAAVARLAGKRPPLAVAAAPAPSPAAEPVRERVPPAPAPATGARLQLDPVDLPAVAGPVAAAGAQQPVPDPAAAPDLAAAPDPAQAATEPAAPAPTELQQELQALRAEQERMQLALQTLNAQLLQAQAQAPWPAYATYGLGGLALLLLGGLWFALRTGRLVLAGKPKTAEMPWWESSLTAPAADPDSALPARPSATATPAAAATSEPGPKTLAATNAGSAAPLAAQFPELQKTAYAPAAPVLSSAPQAAPAPSAAPAPVPAPAAAEPLSYDFPVWLPGEAVEGMEVAEGRASMFSEVPVSALDLRQLSDVWQQIEFCESIGQQRQAMELLKAFVTEHPRASEAVYLRWLALAGQHGNEAERSEAIRFYENHFLRLAPRPDAILATQGLDEDAAMLQRLQREWPQAAAQHLLEQALGSQPGDPQSPLTVRTLAAFDDLMHLLGVLQGLASSPAPALAAALSEPMQWHALDGLGLPPLQTPVAAAPAAPAANPMSIDFDFSRFDWEGKQDAPKTSPDPDPDPDNQPAPPSGKH